MTIEAMTPATNPVSEMTDRQLLEESVQNQRVILGVITGIVAAMQQHPMFRMLMPTNDNGNTH
jgi:hypothetical protein